MESSDENLSVTRRGNVRQTNSQTPSWDPSGWRHMVLQQDLNLQNKKHTVKKKEKSLDHKDTNDTSPVQ